MGAGIDSKGSNPMTKEACWRGGFWGKAGVEELADKGGISRGGPQRRGEVEAAPALPEAGLTGTERVAGAEAAAGTGRTAVIAVAVDQTAAVGLIAYAAVGIGIADNGAFDAVVAVVVGSM